MPRPPPGLGVLATWAAAALLADGLLLRSRDVNSIVRSADCGLAQLDRHGMVDLVGDDGAFAEHRYSW